jgi:DNA-binding MarR family transcriptional regulator
VSRCDPSFVTAIADGLEERGLVRREVDPEDRRAKNLVLTSKGVTLRAKVQREFFNHLPGIDNLDEAERRTLVELLRKLVHDADGRQ